MMARQLVAALRAVTRTPATALFIVLVLTVSIAASVAIFALTEAALLKPLSYPNPERLVTFTYSFNGVEGRAHRGVESGRSRLPERANARMIGHPERDLIARADRARSP